MNITKLLSLATIATTLMISTAIASSVDVSQPWARASAGMAKTGAAYFTMNNNNDHEHTLLSVKSDVAKRVELHQHIMADGMMKMRLVKGGIMIPAGHSVALQPGGFHVMLIGLHAPLKEGSTFPLTLIFDNGRETTVAVKILPPSAMNSGMAMDHMTKHGENMGSHMGHAGGDHGTDMIHPANPDQMHKNMHK